MSPTSDKVPLLDADALSRERAYLEISAECRALTTIIEYLKSENEHLRHYIDVLVKSH